MEGFDTDMYYMFLCKIYTLGKYILIYLEICSKHVYLELASTLINFEIVSKLNYS